MKESTKGYIEYNWGDSLIYKSKESYDKGNIYSEDALLICELFEKFHDKKVKITIKEIE